jgi:hypothetical protein
MRGQPTVYRVDAALVLRGLLDPDSEARTVLDLAACNMIEAHASSGDWNLVMWALQQTLTKRGLEPMSGENLQNLRSALPVSFRG